jgi:hypothetical protein
LVYAQAVRQAELYARFFQQVVHDSLELVAGLVVGDGCATDQAPLVASMIVAQARGPQFDLLATSDHERVGARFRRCSSS